MNTPRHPDRDDRRHGRNDRDHPGRPDDVERRLRTSLERHSLEAPEADLIAERILHTADRSSARNRPRRRVSWAPSLAAAVVLFVIGGVILAITTIGSGGDRPDTTAAASAPPRTSQPSAASTTTPTPKVVAPAPSSVTSATAPSGEGSSLHHIRLVDLTFDGVDSGWALGSADCLGNSGKRCTALLHTSDGSSWQARPGATFNVPGVNGCASPCVSHIRFATPTVGYAYGPSAFFMTRDGGAHWIQQGSGGALALESLDNNVVRVTSPLAGCARGACELQAQTSPIGSTTWTTRNFGRYPSTPVVGVALSRSGTDVYLLFQGRHSSIDLSRLYVSRDDGVTWTSSGEPCRQPASGASSHGVAVAAAPDGRVSVLCRLVGGDGNSAGGPVVDTSTDHGAHFAAQGVVPDTAGRILAGDPATVLAAGGDKLTHSSDGGDTWTTVSGTGEVTFVGFESPTVGRALTDGGRTIWTTRNAGKTWTRVGLG